MNTVVIAVVTAICICIVITAIGIFLAIRITQGRSSLTLTGCCFKQDRLSRRNRSRQCRREAQREDDAFTAKARDNIDLLPLDSVLEKLKGTRAKENYTYACQYAETHPIDESEGRLSNHDHEYVMENGANAWEFVPTDENAGVVVRNCTELEFPGREQSLIANLQFPNEQRVYYFEVRLDNLPESTNVAVGVAMKGYPPLRMAGWAKNSVAYHSIDGHAYYSHPLNVCRQSIGSARTSDTVGVGWRPNSGKMFFAINGAIVCHIRTPWANKRLYPIVSADGPCSLNVNVGARAFVLSYANMRHWSLASTEGARPPPPLYQNVSGTVLLEATPHAPEYPGEPDRPQHPPTYDSSRQTAKETAIPIEDDSSGFGVIQVRDLDNHYSSSSSVTNILDDTASLDNVPIILRRDSSDSLAAALQCPTEIHRRSADTGISAPY